MRNIWIIARREYKQYFISPIAYTVAFLFLIILGYFFNQNLADALVQSSFQQVTPSVQMVIGPMITLLLFTMPAVTMRTLAEEQRMGTIELLLTAPVRDWELVVGKWLGGFLFTLTLLAITWIYPIILNQMVDPGIDQGLLISGYLGLILIVGSLVAIGVTISSFFTNQIAAFFVSLAVVLLIWIIRPSSSATGLWNEVFSYLNYLDHFYTFYQGTIDLKDVIYFLSIIALALFLGSVSIESRRWR